MDEEHLTIPQQIDAGQIVDSVPDEPTEVEFAQSLDESGPVVEPEEVAQQDIETVPETPEHPPNATLGRAVSNDKPFSILLIQSPSGQPGHDKPHATLEIAPALRTSGLLAALSADEVKTLMCLLTFLSPNGDILPTMWEVAKALQISETKAQDRLTRLVRFRWQQRPIVATLWRESGITAYTVSPEFIAYRQLGVPESAATQPAYRAAGRDAVITASRAKYTRPRAEVERQIAMMQGWPLPDEEAGDSAAVTSGEDISPEGYLRQRLLRVGVTTEQIDLLFETFPLEEIDQQITWLPYRAAKHPTSYLLAAINGRYEEPRSLRLKREHQTPGSDDLPGYQETT